MTYTWLLLLLCALITQREEYNVPIQRLIFYCCLIVLDCWLDETIRGYNGKSPVEHYSVVATVLYRQTEIGQMAGEFRYRTVDFLLKIRLLIDILISYAPPVALSCWLHDRAILSYYNKCILVYVENIFKVECAKHPLMKIRTIVPPSNITVPSYIIYICVYIYIYIYYFKPQIMSIVLCVKHTQLSPSPGIALSY